MITVNQTRLQFPVIFVPTVISPYTIQLSAADHLYFLKIKVKFIDGFDLFSYLATFIKELCK